MAVKKPRIVSIETMQNRIKKEVKTQSKKTKRNPEELLFEALAREGLIPVDLKRREERINAVRTALEGLTPLQIVVLYERAARKKTFKEIWQSDVYKKATRTGSTSLSRVGNVYNSAIWQFKTRIEKSGILERK
ncbi:MAG: hypothetical protein V1672_00555 [Candidatus Diapherotrites archaeon]